MTIPNSTFFCGGGCDQFNKDALDRAEFDPQVGRIVFSNTTLPAKWEDVQEQIIRLTEQNEALVELVSAYQNLFRGRLL